MKLKKILTFAFMTAIIICGLSGVTQALTISAYAAETGSNSNTPASISVSYGDDLIIKMTSPSGTKDNYLFLEVLKENKADSSVSATYCYPTTAWQINESTTVYGVKVDSSFLKIGAKEIYLRVYGDVNTTKSEITTIAVQTAKFSMKYVPGKTTVKDSFTVGKNTALTADTVKTYEYRTLYGSTWMSLEELDIATMAVTGGTIVVRQQTYDEDGETIIAPASAEVKVKISASPKAPKIVVDYVKSQIKLPKASEVQISVAGNPNKYTNEEGEVIKYKSSTEKVESLTRDELIEKFAKVAKSSAEDQAAVIEELTDSDFTIIVNTAASAKAAASLPTFVEIKKAAEITSETGKVTVGEATMTYTFDNDKVTFKADKANFEVCYEQKNGIDSWVTIRAGKDSVITRKKLGSATKIKIRAAGVKEDLKKSIIGQFASQTTEITIPAATDSSKAAPKASDFTFTKTAYSLTKNNVTSVAYGKTTGATGMGNVTAVHYKSEGADWTETVPTAPGEYQVAIDVAAGTSFNAGTMITDESWVVTLQEYTVTLEEESEAELNVKVYLYENENATAEIYDNDGLTESFITVVGTQVYLHVGTFADNRGNICPLTSAKYRTNLTQTYSGVNNTYGYFNEYTNIAVYTIATLTTGVDELFFKGSEGELLVPVASLFSYTAPTSLSLSENGGAITVPESVITIKSGNESKTGIDSIMYVKCLSDGSMPKDISAFWNRTTPITEPGKYQIAIDTEEVEGGSYAEWQFLTDSSWTFTVTE